MSEAKAIALAREFHKLDASHYYKTGKAVEKLISEGYTPEEALMLNGYGGYDN
jgi:hypothetical protein